MTINSKHRMGLWTLVALVIGNMIGSGIFMLPADLARIGSISLLAWVFTSFGAFMLALVFAKMSFLVPKAGGPYAYAKEGFGEFIGFQTAYIHWIALWVGNASVVVALIGSLQIFFPWLAIPKYGISTGLGVIWLITLVNISGIRSAGAMQIVTTVLKFVPLFLVIAIGCWYFHPEYITNSFNVTTKTNFSAFSHAATLTLWAFVGIESATVPLGLIENAKRNIPLATLIGAAITIVIYIASTVAIMGVLPGEVLAHSPSPFASAIGLVLGDWGKYIAAGGVCIACLGCLNGEILLQGQVPMAIADENLFPKIFAKRNNAGMPIFGLVISSILLSLIFLLTSDSDLIGQFQLLILVAATLTLITYLISALAEIMLLAKSGKVAYKQTSIVIAISAAIYAFWAIFGAGRDIIFYTCMLIFSSFVMYIWVSWQKKNRN